MAGGWRTTRGSGTGALALAGLMAILGAGGTGGVGIAQDGGALPKGPTPGIPAAPNSPAPASSPGAKKPPGKDHAKQPKAPPKGPKTPNDAKPPKNLQDTKPASPAGPTEAGAGPVNGALPKGAPNESADIKAKPASATGPVDSEGKPIRPCWEDYASLPGGNAVWDIDGNLWILAQNVAKGGNAPKAKAGLNALVRHTLFLVHPKDRKTEPILSLDLKPGGGTGVPSLVLHGSPVSGVSAVVFSGSTGNSCYEGTASVVSIALGNAAKAEGAQGESAAVHGKGNYQFVEVPGGRWLYDVKKSNIVQLDPVTFQSKFVRRPSLGDRPLWLETRPGQGRRLVSWHDAGKQRGLIGAAVEDDPTPRRLAFAKEDRVAQDADRFAAVRVDPKNRLTVRELPDWSRVAKPGVFSFALPPTFAAKDSAVGLRIAPRLAIVQGATLLVRQQWQRAFLVDYAKSKTIAEAVASPTQYIHMASLDPSGSYAVFEVRDRATRQSIELRIFSMKKKVFATVPLVLP